MSDMKLIMENWRRFFGGADTQAPADEIQTVGDLKKFIRAIRSAKAGKEIGKKALEAFVDAIPILGDIKSVLDAAKDSGEIIKKLYGMGDEVETNTNLDKLNVDDQVSKIVDDPIEVAFLNYLLKNRFNDDNESLENFDATAELQKFLASKFQGTTVKK